MYYVYRPVGQHWKLEEELPTLDEAKEALKKWPSGYIGFEGRVIYVKQFD